jgi:hypothetical protein
MICLLPAFHRFADFKKKEPRALRRIGAHHQKENAMRIGKVTALAAILTLGLASGAMAQTGGSAGAPAADQSSGSTGATGASSGSGSTGSGMNNGATAPGSTNSSSGGYQETAPGSSNPNGNAPAGAQQHQ